jgi:hypothetical protein
MAKVKVIRKTKRTAAPSKVKVHRVSRNAVNRRRKVELIRLVDNLAPEMYDDAISHLRVLSAVQV